MILKIVGCSQSGFKGGLKIVRRFISAMATGNAQIAWELQRETLKCFLDQRERAIEYNNNSGVNEVHVCCDMNLDALNGRWLLPT